MMLPGSQVVPPVVHPAGGVGTTAACIGVRELPWCRSAAAGIAGVTADSAAGPVVGELEVHAQAGVALVLLAVDGADRGPLEPRMIAPARTRPAIPHVMTAPSAFSRPAPACRRASGRPGRGRFGVSVRSSAG